MDFSLLDVLTTTVVPIVTGVLGWLGSAYRNKQKKESDIMSNFKEMMSIQNDFISGLKANVDERDKTLRETKEINHRLEQKLDKKERSIRRANFCKFSNEGDGCPVLVQEDEDCRDSMCDTCKHRNDTDKN